uniref:Uncharacterized protein n=1 Tax=Lepeophtheirus salmonis TaxID=72036 RepID=A0A0K2VEU6_LEPSM
MDIYIFIYHAVTFIIYRNISFKNKQEGQVQNHLLANSFNW